ncbi:amino acid ABC transporter permease [Celeribacter sp. SCSIO 80788]|uniref:amino acid ABC transporter permease n=1 Tax=Celeribacter sp. SCSIO 80788 TaxID=3117013 RepID=UPI003DA45712
MNLDFSVLMPYLPLLAQGAQWTVLLTAAGAVLSILGGVAFAVAVLYAPRAVQLPLRSFIWLFMGTPLLLQLFLLYYGLGQIGIRIPAIWVGVTGLGLHFAVYNADIFRTAIQTVEHGQTEGARSLGFGRAQTLRYVVVPQALRRSLPQVGNNLIAMLKDASIVSMLGMTELVYAAQQGISETYRPFEFYFAVAVIYYLLNLVLELALAWAGRKVEAQR